MRLPLVFGNWKMNGTQASVTALLQALCSVKVKKAKVAVFPPFVYLDKARQLLQTTAVAWGGQNLCSEEKGAYTGEISAPMLAEFNCRYVLIGHSERRTLYFENEQLIAKKFLLAKEFGLTPVLCVGETLEEYQQNKTAEVINNQLRLLLSVLPNASALENAVIAYEPVWAIGTGKTATGEQAQAVHAKIRKHIATVNSVLASRIPIIYGGSVKASNAASLFAMPDIDGGLIGGASLDAQEFLEIIHIADNAIKSEEICNNSF